MKNIFIFFTIIIFILGILLFVENKLSIEKKEIFNNNIIADISKLLKETGFNDEILDGKIIVLNLWATWCKPCIEEIPHLNNLVDLYKNEEIIFIALTRETSDKVNFFLQNKNINFKYMLFYEQIDLYNYFINLKSNKFLKVETLPMNIIINKDGKLTYLSIGHSNNSIKNLEKSIISSLK